MGAIAKSAVCYRRIWSSGDQTTVWVEWTNSAVWESWTASAPNGYSKTVKVQVYEGPDAPAWARARRRAYDDWARIPA